MGDFMNGLARIVEALANMIVGIVEAATGMAGGMYQSGATAVAGSGDQIAIIILAVSVVAIGVGVTFLLMGTGEAVKSAGGGFGGLLGGAGKGIANATSWLNVPAMLEHWATVEVSRSETLRAIEESSTQMTLSHGGSSIKIEGKGKYGSTEAAKLASGGTGMSVPLLQAPPTPKPAAPPPPRKKLLGII